MDVKVGMKFEACKYGVGPYLWVKVTLDHDEVSNSDIINRIADIIADRIVSMFAWAAAIKAIITALWGELTPQDLAGKDQGAGVIVKLYAPVGGIGLPYSKVITRTSDVAVDEPHITLYEHANFKGRSLNTVIDIPHTSFYDFQDCISSIKTTGGMKAIVYQHANYQGRAFVVNGDVSSLSSHGFNDSISSIKIGAPLKGVTVFKHASFKGPSCFIENSLSTFKSIDFNDEISSVRLHGNVKCTVFKHANFKGKSAYLESDAAHLSSYDLNDEVSSIAIFP